MGEENQSQPGAVQPQTKSAQPAAKSKPSSTALIVILIVVFVLILLGVGGYFGWKYLNNKDSEEKTSESTEEDIPQRLENLELLFKYPESEITKTGHSAMIEESIDTSDMEMETSDEVMTVYYYYMKLASEEHMGLGSRGSATDGSGAFLKIEEEDFTANFDIESEESGKTKISLRLQIGSFEASTDYDYDLGSSNTSSAEKSGTMPQNDYVISDSDTRIISKSELSNLTPWQLKVARNEIYARHGRAFVHKDLQCYLATQSWYQVNSSYSSSSLTLTENKNIATILNYEKEINSPLLGVDSGC
ncbi:MAG: YARHG domain-containing protein [bacterium]